MQIIKGTRESILRPLQIVSGIVERRHTMPILANVLVRKSGPSVSFIATDTEVQITTLADNGAGGEVLGTTVATRKLLDILKALPEKEPVTISLVAKKMTVQCGKSRFSMQTLPAEDFPTLAEVTGITNSISVSQRVLKRLLQMVSFSMASNDIRYYLNGLLLALDESSITTVATDGHRLAKCTISADVGGEPVRAIIPRKTVIELQRLLEESDDLVQIDLSDGRAKFSFGDIELVSKLVEGKFPDYTRVIPTDTPNEFVIDREIMLRSLQRAAIMTSDKFKGVTCQIQPGAFRLSASNADSEEALEELEIDYGGAELKIGFNVTYLLDVLSNLKSEQIRVSFGKTSNESMLVSMADNTDFKYVVMPMRI